MQFPDYSWATDDREFCQQAAATPVPVPEPVINVPGSQEIVTKQYIAQIRNESRIYQNKAFYCLFVEVSWNLIY